MIENKRIVYINEISITITDLDYDELDVSFNNTAAKLNVTFDVLVHDKPYTINFNNADDQDHTKTTPFKGAGATYAEFLKKVETDSALRDKNEYSENTENSGNDIFGTIAQSVYEHLQAYSPDQGEE